MPPQNQQQKKHPDAIAWDEWLNSEEGKSCTQGQPIGIYLQNRLFRAFMAGKKDTRHQAVLAFVERVKAKWPQFKLESGLSKDIASAYKEMFSEMLDQEAKQFE